MIRHVKSAKNLSILISKSWNPSKKSVCQHDKVWSLRTYAKDERFTAGENVWRKTSVSANISSSNKPRPIRPSPNKVQDLTESVNLDASRLNVEKSGRNVSAINPCVKLEPQDCVTLPHICPPPSPLTASAKAESPHIKLEVSPKKVEYPLPASSTRDLKESTSSPKPDIKEKVVEDTSEQPQKTIKSPPAKPPEDTPKKSNESTSKPSGGDLSKKWLWAFLAVALGGGLAYYLYYNNDEKEQTADGVVKKSRGGRRKRPVRPVLKFPPTSGDLPKQVQYLLIGGGTASFSAFRSIKSLDPKAEVLVIAKEPEFPYMRPPLSKEMWNSDRTARDTLMFRQWNGSVRSVYYEPDSFYMDSKTLTSSSKGGVSVARGWEVTSIDAVKKEVTLDDGSTISYGKCLLAPGSKPKPFPLLENASSDVKDKVFYFRDVFDFRDLSEATECPRDIIVIGGGFLGSELSCSLTHQGCKVTQVFREAGLLAKLLPGYLSKWLTQQVRTEGVNVLSDNEVVAVSSKGNRITLTLSNGKQLEADYCIVATGAIPNTDLAETSKLETHPTLGGYLVNSEMLARSNLYIAGDAACFYDERFGRRRVEHHDHAVVSGRLAGENMVGAGKPYLHVSMLWSDLSPDLGWEGVGILDPKLETTGVFALEKEDKNPSEDSPAAQEANSNKPQPTEQFHKGVVFYLKDGVIVGVLLWNIFNRMSIARQVLQQNCKYEDLNEVAKLFNIHSD